MLTDHTRARLVAKLDMLKERVRLAEGLLTADDAERNTVYGSQVVCGGSEKFYEVFVKDGDSPAEREGKKQTLLRYVRAAYDPNVSEGEIDFLPKTAVSEARFFFRYDTELHGLEHNPLIYKNIVEID